MRLLMSPEVDPAAGSDAGSGAGSAPNTVSYESHQKLLDQLKKTKEKEKEMAEKLKSFEDRDREANEIKLKETGEYKKILENRDKEIEALKNQAESFKKNLYNGAKLQAVVDKLPGKIKNKDYLSFIDIDKVAIDPETNHIDEKTVDEVVSEFTKFHSSLMELGGKVKLPNDSSKNDSASLSYQEWLALPLAEKNKRIKDVKKD